MEPGGVIKTCYNCADLLTDSTQTVSGYGCAVSLLHHPEDPSSVNRIRATTGEMTVEIFPSKGFAIGQIYIDERPLLWDAPIGLSDPDTLDLYSDEIAINGKPAAGFTFLRNFSAGIEFYGLRNWGMPVREAEKDFLHPLHGETSNIPVELCDVTIDHMETGLTATFIYRNMHRDHAGVWYRQGEQLYMVERRVVIPREGRRLQLIDRVENISNRPLRPDWGYHVTFRPSRGSRLLVPSASVENRTGEKVPENIELWSPAKDITVREETGIIHKKLAKVAPESAGRTRAVIVHPDQTGARIGFPLTPYFQTWFSRGGAGSHEFTTFSDMKPLFSKNWDGIGIEFGSSALDHDANTDPSVPAQAFIDPGQSLTIRMDIDFLAGEELQRLVAVDFPLL